MQPPTQITVNANSSADKTNTNTENYSARIESKESSSVVNTQAPTFTLNQDLSPSNNQSNLLDTAYVYSVESSTPQGLKIAKGRLVYNDGDVLEGGFRVYCPTNQIRPINYTLTSSSGEVKKTGKWWEESFPPKWKAENELIDKVCN